MINKKKLKFINRGLTNESSHKFGLPKKKNHFPHFLQNYVESILSIIISLMQFVLLAQANPLVNDLKSENSSYPMFVLVEGLHLDLASHYHK